MNRFVENVLTFVLGASMGIIAGILLAPKKGSETQRELRDRGKQVFDDLEDKLEEGKKRMEELSETIKDYQFSTSNGSSPTEEKES